MDTIFMNSKNSKTSDTHGLTLTLKKNFVAPFYGWGSTVSGLQSHC